MARLATVTIVLLVVGAPLAAGLAGGATAPAAAEEQQKVDVVVVFDRTQSANEDRYHLAQEIDALRAQFAERGIDARYGLVTYNREATVRQPLTADFDRFQAAMAFAESGSTERASDAILTAMGMEFREGAERAVVVVTDEDDDSSNATRERALSALSGVHFVAVSPADPAESSCAVHSPPCDSRSDNELRTMADRVGGDWIGQGQDAATIVDGIGDAVTSATRSGSGGGDDPETDSPPALQNLEPDIEISSAAANRTTAEVGDPVAFNATLVNDGPVPGNYRARLSNEGQYLDEQSVRVAALGSRTMTFVHRFESPGDHEVWIDGRLVATVTVVPPRNATVETTSEPNRTAVTASVTDAWAGGTVSVPLDGASLLDPDAAELDAVVVSVGEAKVTPPHDVAFDLSIAASETPPSGVDPLPEHVAETTYLRVNGTHGAPIAGLEFAYAAASNRTTLYRYHDSGWVAVDESPSTAAPATAGADGSLYAVGVRKPAFEVSTTGPDDRELATGETITAALTVENEGAAAGTYNATLAVDGTVVAAERVTLAPGESRRVTLAYTPDGPGQYTVGVAGTAWYQVTVDRRATATATPTPDAATPTASRTGTPTAGDATTAGTAADGGTPDGVLLLGTVVFGALLVGAAARRRR